MIKSLKKYFTANYAVDLGTYSVKIFCPEKGLILEEPSIVILNGNEVVAIGDKAKLMINKIPKNYSVVYPIQNSKIFDFNVAELLIGYFLEKVQKDHPNKFYKPSPNIVTTISTNSTPIDQKNVKELFFKSGASEVSMIPQSIACALGLGLPIEENECFFLFNIGAGTTELTVISNNEIIQNKIIDQGGISFSEAIQEVILQKEHMQISFQTAEYLKNTVGSFNSKKEEEKILITGQDKLLNHPIEKEISNKLIIQTLRNHFSYILNKFLKLLQEINPDMATDLYKKGIYLVGGGAMIDSLAENIEETLYLKVNTVKKEEMRYCAVKGCLSYLK